MAGLVGYHAGRIPDRVYPLDLHPLVRLMMPQRGALASGPLSDVLTGLAFCSPDLFAPERGLPPFASESGQVWVVADGEPLNALDLRADLEAQGHRFRSSHPVEVLAHLYERDGVGMLDHLRGSFALAVIDRAAGRVLLARDHMGAKPLYYAEHAGGIVFASEIRPLLAAGVSAEPDPESIHYYLTFGSVPSPLTMYRHIRRLRPATRLIWEQGTGDLKVEGYWDIQFRPAHTAGEHELSAELHRRLLDSVERHLAIDSPVGVSISGGIDSTIVTGLVREFKADRLPSFFVGYHASTGLPDERDYARLVATHYGTEHHEIFIGPEDILRELPRSVELLEQPMETSTMEYFLSMAALPHSRYLLSGDIADSLFCGTSYYSVLALLERYRRLSRPVHGLLDAVMPHWPRDLSLFGKHPRVAYDALSPASRLDPAGRYISLKAIFTDADKARLYAPEWAHSASAFNTTEFAHMYFSATPLEDVIEETLLVMQKREVPDVYLLDSLMTGTGIEHRSPFVDRSLVDFVSRIPWQWKFRNGFQKYILVQAGRKYLPEAVIQRPKRGFSLPPFSQWLLQDLAPVIHTALSEHAVRRRGLLRWEEVDTLLQRFFSGRESAVRVWVLVMLELWFRRFVDGKPLDLGGTSK